MGGREFLQHVLHESCEPGHACLGLGHGLHDGVDRLSGSKGFEVFLCGSSRESFSQVCKGQRVRVFLVHTRSNIAVVRGVSRRTGYLVLAVLLHELLRGARRHVEDIQDMLLEIPRRHFGFERSQQSTERYVCCRGSLRSYSAI